MKTLFASLILQAIKTGRSGNEAVRVGIPALYQDQVKLLAWSDFNRSCAQTPSHVNQTRLQHCLPQEC